MSIYILELMLAFTVGTLFGSLVMMWNYGFFGRLFGKEETA